MRRGSFWLVLLLGATGVSACRAKDAPAPAKPGESAVAAPAASSVVAPAPAAPAPAFVEDALWKQAGRGDPIDLARLAAREGAAGLLEGVEAGGAVGRTALAALPIADDGELALGRLCEILARTPSDQIEPVLRAVHGIVARPPAQRERVDATGYRACAPVVTALAARSDLAAPLRDLASSAREALVEHGATQ
jgi:hypothetical protein